MMLLKITIRFIPLIVFYLLFDIYLDIQAVNSLATFGELLINGIVFIILSVLFHLKELKVLVNS